MHTLQQKQNTSIALQVASYNQATDEDSQDAILAEIGSSNNILPTLSNMLTAQQRCQILDWLVYEREAQIEGDLAPRIFGEKQLTEWREESRRRYPDFELVVEVCKGEECLLLSCHYQALPGAPQVNPECDFPSTPFFDSVEMFWYRFGEEETNDLEFTWRCYPNQSCFTWFPQQFQAPTGEIQPPSKK